MAQSYVLGFAFDKPNGRFLLIRKNRPEWQAGLLNGVGGKIEPTDISHFAAMAREFKEEAGIETFEEQWQVVGSHHASNLQTNEPHYTLFIFGTELSPEQTLEMKSLTDEEVEWHSFTELGQLWPQLVPGCGWYIAMAENSLGRHMSTMTSELT